MFKLSSCWIRYIYLICSSSIWPELPYLLRWFKTGLFLSLWSTFRIYGKTFSLSETWASRNPSWIDIPLDDGVSWSTLNGYRYIKKKRSDLKYYLQFNLAFSAKWVMRDDCDISTTLTTSQVQKQVVLQNFVKPEISLFTRGR